MMTVLTMMILSTEVMMGLIVMMMEVINPFATGPFFAECVDTTTTYTNTIASLLVQLYHAAAGACKSAMCTQRRNVHAI